MNIWGLIHMVKCRNTHYIPSSNMSLSSTFISSYAKFVLPGCTNIVTSQERVWGILALVSKPAPWPVPPPWPTSVQFPRLETSVFPSLSISQQVSLHPQHVGTCTCAHTYTCAFSWGGFSISIAFQPLWGLITCTRVVVPSPLVTTGQNFFTVCACESTVGYCYSEDCYSTE